jgi:hypothetical protein
MVVSKVPDTGVTEAGILSMNMNDESDEGFECIHFDLNNVKLPKVE